MPAPPMPASEPSPSPSPPKGRPRAEKNKGSGFTQIIYPQGAQKRARPERNSEEGAQPNERGLVSNAVAVGSVDLLPSSDVVTPKASTPRASTPRASSLRASSPRASASLARKKTAMASSMPVPTNAVAGQAAVTKETEEGNSLKKTRS